MLITNPPNSLRSLLIAYNTTLSFLLDKHAPVITKFSSCKSKSNPWFTCTLRAFKSTVRRAENIWKRTHYAINWSLFKSLRYRYHNLILAFKKQYYSNLISSSSDNPRRLWQTINKLLHSSPLPTCTSDQVVPHQQQFLNHEQISHQTCIVGLVKYLSSYTGRISD